MQRLELGCVFITFERRGKVIIFAQITSRDGAALPLAVTAVAPERLLISSVAGTSLVFLALLGAVAARAAGAAPIVGAARGGHWPWRLPRELGR